MEYTQSGSNFVVTSSNKGPRQTQVIMLKDLPAAKGATTDQIKEAITAVDFSNNRSQTVENINAQLTQIRNDNLSERVGQVTNLYGEITGSITSINNTNQNGTVNYAEVSNKGSAGSNTRTLGGDLSKTEATPAKELSTTLSKNKERVFEYKTSSGFKMQETLSGADLCVYYLAEVLDEGDLAMNVPPEACKKNLITIEFDSVLSITISTIRERFPVRSLGLSNPKGMTSGIRTISGHVAFNVFAEDVLARLRGRVLNEIEHRRNSILKEVMKEDKASKKEANRMLSTLNDEVKIYNQTPLFREGSKSMLLDQLPPFHLLIMGVNENGIMARMLLKNVYIIDESQYQGTQQPNIINKITWVAEDIVPMTAQEYSSAISYGSLTAIEEGYVGGNWDWKGADMSASSLLIDIEADSILRKTAQGV